MSLKNSVKPLPLGKSSKNLGVTLDAATKEKLRQYAERTHRTMSQAAAMFIEQGLEAVESEEKKDKAS